MTATDTLTEQQIHELCGDCLQCADNALTNLRGGYRSGAVKCVQYHLLGHFQITADTITDEQIRALRDERRAVGEIETVRCCNAALGLPTGDGALGWLDQRTCRERVAKIFESDTYHLRNTRRAP